MVHTILQTNASFPVFNRLSRRAETDETRHRHPRRTAAYNTWDQRSAPSGRAPARSPMSTWLSTVCWSRVPYVGGGVPYVEGGFRMLKAEFCMLEAEFRMLKAEFRMHVGGRVRYVGGRAPYVGGGVPYAGGRVPYFVLTN